MSTSVPSLVSIGCCDSSGSTFFARMLDRHPAVACGDELFLFSCPTMYVNYEGFRRWSLAARRFGISGNPYHQGRAMLRNLRRYGLSRARAWSWVKESQNLRDLALRFRDYILERTGKKLWVEKTPRNVRLTGRFLETFPDAKSIVLVRDPRDVLASLLGRGKTALEAAESWTAAVAAIQPHRENPRLRVIRYEDLCRNHDDVLLSVCEFLGVEADLDVFRNNDHTSRGLNRFEGHKSWGLKPSHAPSVDSIGRYKKADVDVGVLGGVKLTEEFARLVGTEARSLVDLAASHGYELRDVEPKNGTYTAVRKPWSIGPLRRWVDRRLGAEPYVPVIEHSAA